MNVRAMDAETLQTAADGLLRAWPMAGLSAELEDFLESDEAGNGAWIVLCSGGADSVALLLWLWAAFPERRSALRILHVNHGMRGAESDRDAAFVSELAVALKLWVRIAHKSADEANPGEAALRRCREEAVGSLCGREPVAAVFTGHQADDVAENLLFRLGRGAGLTGLGGLRPIQRLQGQPPRVRPLLARTRSEIRETLAAHSVSWREDRSNHTDAFTRNRLRSEVVPAWHSAMGAHDPLQGVLRSHRYLREADAAITVWVDRFFDSLAGGVFSVAALNELPVAVARRVLARWWREHHPDRETLGDDLGDRILGWLADDPEGPFTVGQFALCASADALSFRPLSASEDTSARIGEREWILTPESALSLPNGGTVAAVWRDVDAGLRSKIREGAYPCSGEVFLANIDGPLRIRGWRPGDRFRPLGAPGRRKLQDLFVDAGIPRDRRHAVPVVCDRAGAILWVPGLTPAEACRVGSETTGALWLTYRES